MLNTITSLFFTAQFNLQQLENFPHATFLELIDYYNELEKWYSGEPLKEKVLDKTSGKSIEKYPIKINPLKGTCQKHAATVMGQNVDSIRFGGLPFQLIPEVEKGSGKNKAGKAQAETIKKALMAAFIDNSFGASFLSNCIVAQYLGGSVVAAKWLPQENRIEISTPSPKEFYGIPDGSNYWRLREGWIIKEVTELDAKALGYVPVQNERQFFYIEYYTKTTYKIMINGKVINLPGTDIPQEGENVFGKVPIVYIPHIRTSGFLGDPIITDTVRGVIKELNLRMADIGDAVNDDSHGYVAVRNVRGNIKNISLPDKRPVLDLGGSSGIGNESQPDLLAVNTTSASEPMINFSKDLYQIYRREVNHPAVADGEDEGSQRSSLTLNVRMAPLVSEAEMERLFYSVGITEFAGILLTMMAKKKLFDITDDMIKTNFLVQWQSMLPKDREALTTEAAVRSKNKLGSAEHLISLFGDVQDTEEELEKIRSEKDLYQMPTQNNFGNNNNSGPTKPAAK